MTLDQAHLLLGVVDYHLGLLLADLEFDGSDLRGESGEGGEEGEDPLVRGGDGDRAEWRGGEGRGKFDHLNRQFLAPHIRSRTSPSKRHSFRSEWRYAASTAQSRVDRVVSGRQREPIDFWKVLTV